MPGLQKGAVCVKTSGRNSGKKVVVLEFDRKSGFAVVEGPMAKKKRCNIMHLFPTGKVVNVPAGADKKKLAELIKGAQPGSE
ncbi:MAG: 50S ribosomal protein L14e [Candidatus Diapherotrites archaeon]|nr:50S ribosomal protein L14e [Candidatus Diapherotrites archaeon]